MVLKSRPSRVQINPQALYDRRVSVANPPPKVCILSSDEYQMPKGPESKSSFSFFRRDCLRNLVYFTLAFGGCFLQIYHISSQYFKYDTVTQLSITRPSSVVAPTLISCFDFRRVFVREKVLKLLQLHRNDSDPEHFMPTIAELLSITPEPNEIIGSCAQHLRGTLYEKDNCSHLVIKKSLKQQNICYSFTLKNYSYDYMHITNGMSAPRFFAIYLKVAFFKRTPYMFLYVKSNGFELKGPSSTFLENFRQMTNSTSGTGQRNYVTVSYAKLASFLLPSPYKSDCLNYLEHGFTSQDDCYESCLRQKSIERFDKLPYTILSQADHVTNNHSIMFELDNATIYNEFQKLENQCKILCQRPACYSEDFVPKILTAELHDQLGLDLYVSNEPLIKTQFLSKITHVDYLSFCLSCAGFWMGFCPYAVLRKWDFISKLAGVKRNKVGLANYCHKDERLIRVSYKPLQIRQLVRENKEISENLALVWSELSNFRTQVDCLYNNDR